MINIEKLNASHMSAIHHITLAEEQIKFASTVDAFLADSSETMHLHVIKYHDDVVGFFKIDIAYSSTFGFCSEPSVGLRTFVIDAKLQGKGIGSNAVKALLPYLKENYPHYHSLYLTVNCQNPGAVSCYQKAGLQDTGELYLGGAAGPQHIMKAKIV
ncbi:MAG: GNAT family N-acetyltransferase [Moritella sp.]|uniref:GNAT family N-acetyltransferase n=1 Tax=Moritella sp. TaxID=78556 RepID=UPI00216FE565|nr:GNAT family N-acetyltransferase [Moritella sp.]MBL1415368.1 GNAT family N-acetyltransferase [Moritella sp.]